VDHVGLPCILKDAHGGGWKEVYVCRTLEELIERYNDSGPADLMVVQEFIEWDQYIRCLCHRPGAGIADEVRPRASGSTMSTTSTYDAGTGRTRMVDDSLKPWYRR
jgi:hypothetical protein